MFIRVHLWPIALRSGGCTARLVKQDPSGCWHAQSISSSNDRPASVCLEPLFDRPAALATGALPPQTGESRARPASRPSVRQACAGCPGLSPPPASDAKPVAGGLKSGVAGRTEATRFVYRWVSAQIVGRAGGSWPCLWEHDHSPKARKGRLRAHLWRCGHLRHKAGASDFAGHLLSDVLLYFWRPPDDAASAGERDIWKRPFRSAGACSPPAN